MFLSSCFSFQTRTDLVLVKFYYNVAVRHFVETFRKFVGKRLWWKRFLRKFKLFKMDSGKGVFLSVSRTPFYGCLQTLNRKEFLWMITLFGANTTESSKICQFLIKSPEILWRETFFTLSTCKLYVFFEKYSSQKHPKLLFFFPK